LSFSIAVAGKGGSGKTSTSSLIIRYLLKNAMTPILAVDADPNANLGESLGLNVRDTVGKMLDAFQKDKIDIPSGMSKEAYLEFKLNSLLLESQGMDLLAMGQAEGQGCYCYPNTILRKFIDQLSGGYAFMVMDNEAGMEHLSRGTTQDIDELLIISNHSIKGVRTLGRITELVKGLKLNVKHRSIVISMAPPRIDSSIMEELRILGLTLDSVLPLDEQIVEFDLKRRSLLELPDDSPAVLAVGQMMSRILPQRLGRGLDSGAKV
jgi:CO dehydrogenase maturation factor